MPDFAFRPLLGEAGLLLAADFGLALILRPGPTLLLPAGLPRRDADVGAFTFGGAMRIAGLGVTFGRGGWRVTVGGADNGCGFAGFMANPFVRTMGADVGTVVLLTMVANLGDITAGERGDAGAE